MYTSNPIIFLDIDGVLNSNIYPADSNIFIYNVKINKSCIEVLKQILEKTNSKIVITSSYKSNMEILFDIFSSFGIDKHIIIGKTSTLSEISNNTRGLEIDFWFKNNNLEDFKKYLILDDNDEFLKYQKENFIKVNSFTGLTKEYIDQSISILTEECGKRDNKKYD